MADILSSGAERQKSVVTYRCITPLLAVAAVRGQVAMMRPWASRLTQLGVRGSWAKSAIRRQFVIVVSAALPLGLVAGLGPLLISRMLIPSVPIVVPWAAVGALVASLAAAMTAAAWISTVESPIVV